MLAQDRLIRSTPLGLLNSCLLHTPLQGVCNRYITIRPADQAEREQWAHSQTLPHRQVQRARILLALAQPQSLVQVSAAVGVSVKTVLAWRDRYAAEGLDGLTDRPRSGCPPTDTEADRDAMWAKLQDAPPDGHAQWSLSLMARETGISKAQLQRWWAAAEVQPYRTLTFKRSNDSQFEKKVRDVVGLYPKKTPDEVVLSLEEKPQIQALERTEESLPVTAGQAATRTHDYIRHGTLTLFAALDIHTGKVYYAWQARQRHPEFLAFLRQLARRFPTQTVHLILDNHTVHRHHKVKAWQEGHLCFQFHFTPTYSSWPNQVGALVQCPAAAGVGPGLF